MIVLLRSRFSSSGLGKSSGISTEFLISSAISGGASEYLSAPRIALLISLSSLSPVTGSYDSNQISSSGVSHREDFAVHLAVQVAPRFLVAMPRVSIRDTVGIYPGEFRLIETYAVLFDILHILFRIPLEVHTLRYRVNTKCQYALEETGQRVTNKRLNRLLLPIQQFGFCGDFMRIKRYENMR